VNLQDSAGNGFDVAVHKHEEAVGLLLGWGRCEPENRGYTALMIAEFNGYRI